MNKVLEKLKSMKDNIIEKASAIILMLIVILAIVTITIASIKIHRQKKLVDTFALENTRELSKEPARYSFMPSEMSKYIVDLSSALDIDTDMCVAILMTENPEFNSEATHENANGTMDVGLWQLNDRYLWSSFYNDYWKFSDVEFNPMDWKNSTYIALCHVKSLQDRHKTFDDIIMSYNCGSGAVMSNNVPESTKKYLANVKNNYTLLKNRSETK